MSLRLAAQSPSFGKCHFPVFSHFAASDSDVMDRWASSGWQTVGSGSTCTFELHLLNLRVIKNKHEMTDCSSKNPVVFPSFSPPGMCVETSYGTATAPRVSYGFVVPPALLQVIGLFKVSSVKRGMKAEPRCCCLLNHLAGWLPCCSQIRLTLGT